MIGNDCFYCPPVRIGDVLFEVFDDPDDEETPMVFEFRVRGIAIMDGEWYVCDTDREFVLYDETYFFKDKESAEEAMKAWKA